VLAHAARTPTRSFAMTITTGGGEPQQANRGRRERAQQHGPQRDWHDLSLPFLTIMGRVAAVSD